MVPETRSQSAVGGPEPVRCCFPVIRTGFTIDSRPRPSEREWQGGAYVTTSPRDLLLGVLDMDLPHDERVSYP